MVLFNKEPDFKDADDSYMTFNYTTYPKSIYSMW